MIKDRGVYMNEDVFSGLGGLYRRSRPDYPQALFDYLTQACGLKKSSSTAADIGAGTGKLTSRLLDICARVWAIEPNADMRAQLMPQTGLISVDGTAEATGLADGCADLVTAAQAFHWFDTERFRAECKRILKPDSKAALIWNSRDGDSALVAENAAINRTFCPAFHGFSGGMAEEDARIQLFFGGEFTVKKFPNALRYDRASFIARNLSASYAPRPAEDAYDNYIEAVGALFDRYSSGETVVLPNVTRCYLGGLT
ncbi:MAG: class I SAM-dependent methyltransferase [Oscillospiraceae bacterium]